MPVHVPPHALCTDNAAMIASAARYVAPAAVPGVPGARRVRDEARRVSTDPPRDEDAQAPPRGCRRRARPPRAAASRGRRLAAPAAGATRRRPPLAVLVGAAVVVVAAVILLVVLLGGGAGPLPRVNGAPPVSLADPVPYDGRSPAQLRGSEVRVLVQFSRQAARRCAQRALDGRRRAAHA